MKKIYLIPTFLFLTSFSQIYSLSAKSAVVEASKKETVLESIDYLKNTVPKLSTLADKRSGYAFLGSIQEQLGLYEDAQKNYALAASIEATDASGMPKKSSEQLVIDAIRCALSVGDYSTADSYLKSDVKKSKDEKILAHIKLYEQWSTLCKANSIDDTKDSIEILKDYSTSDSMKSVAPSILLTLFHLTGDKSYSTRLTKEFSSSVEASIVKGSSKNLPTPFWYFVPRKGFGDEVPDYEKDLPDVTSVSSDDKKEIASSDENVKRTKYQIGLFRDESNAMRLVNKLKQCGFSGKISEEVRSSGTKYYLVYVEDNDNKTMYELLKASNFDCYPLSEE